MTSLLLSLSMSQSVDLNCVDIDGETVCYRAATEIDGEAVDVKGELDGPHISANWEPGLYVASGISSVSVAALILTFFHQVRAGT